MESESLREAPRLSGHPLLGHYGELRKDPLALFARAFAEHGDYVWVRFAHLSILLVADPEGVRDVLERHAEALPRGSQGSPEILREFLGNGVLTANGALWSRLRADLSPFLQRKAVDGAFSIMSEEVARLVAGLSAKSAGGALDVARATRVAGFRTVSRALVGYEASDGEAEDFTDAVTVFQEQAMDRLLSLAPLPSFIPTRQNRALREAFRVAHALTDRVLAHGQARDAREDYLDVVLEASREHGTKRLSSRIKAALGAKDEGKPDPFWARQMLMTALIVASENPSNTVSWALFMLAERPEWVARIREEAERVFEGGAPREGTIAQLKVARAVLTETLRLYPGGWGVDRQAASDTSVGGHRVPKGSLVFVSPYLTHRSEAVWKRAGEFDPERFLDDRAGKMHKFAYFPFGGGEHRCLGPLYGYQLMQLMLVELLRAFDLERDAERAPTPQALFTLRPGGGVHLRLTPRRSASA